MEKERIDPKNTGVPNINFSIGDETDKREKRWKKERCEDGFDETELWNFNSTIAEFIYPRLKAFITINQDCPVAPDITFDEWNKILNKMLFSFHYYMDNDGGLKFMKKNVKNIDNKDQIASFNNKIKEGLSLFAKYFGSLWC